jgi:carboxyl-terminal processing protease
MYLTSRLQRVVPLAALVLVAACDGETSAPPGMSPTAQAYLEEVIGIMEANSLRRFTIDWPALRSDVFSVAAGAQTIPQTHVAIARALRLLADDHSTFRTPEGAVLSGSSRQCGAHIADPPQLPPGIGYIRVRAFGGDGGDPEVYVGDIRAMMAAFADQELDGWIVDLRGNTGGTMWPMLAAVGPVLGEDTVGYFVEPEGERQAWLYREGAVWLDDVEMYRGPEPGQLRRERPRTAVLTDNLTIGAGEAVAIAFRGRPDSRSFGQGTCGLSTGLSTFTMSDGAVLSLVVTTMADRTGRTYGDFIGPDEVSLGLFQPVDDAIAWLRSSD